MSRGLDMWGTFWDWIGSLPQASASFVGTLTGSSFGLIAILIGALVNASLNRRRDDGVRNHERIAVASTLYAELLGIHRMLSESAEHLANKPPDNDGGFLISEPSAKPLPESLSKIGLLPVDTIRKVMDAYVLMEQYVGDMLLAGGQPKESRPNRQLVYLPAMRAQFVIEYNRIKAEPVKEAMEALTPYLK